MGKQCILENKGIWLPRWERTLKARRYDSPFPFEETVVYEQHDAQFVDVVSEKNADRWRPDLTATLKNGAKLYIEVKVTHGVEPEKARALDNVLEVDLSRLDPADVQDKEKFREQVLRKAYRYWYRCSLYDQLKRVRSARARLDEMSEQNKEQSLREKLKKERQDAAAKRAAEMKAKKGAQFEARESEERRKIMPLLEPLQLVGTTQFETHIQRRREANSRALIAEAEVRLNPVLGESWPQYLDHPITSDWAFCVHRKVWQSYVFEKYVLNSSIGTDLVVREIANDVWQTFGVEPWVENLYHLKQEHMKQGRARRTWYARYGIWFLSKDENKAIPSPYHVMAQFLEELRFWHYLTQVEKQRRYRVIAIEPEQAFRLQKYVTRKPVFHQEPNLQRVLSRPSRATDRPVSDSDRELNLRINRTIEQGWALYHVDVSEAAFCSYCHQIVSSPLSGDCTLCNQGTLQKVPITEGYLRALPTRMRTMPMSPAKSSSATNEQSEKKTV